MSDSIPGEGTRKASGIMLMSTGGLNALLGLLFFVSSVVGGLILGIMALIMIFDGSGSDDPLAELCWVFILIIVIVGFIICLIIIVLSAGFSFLLAGQAIGGYFTYKGTYFKRSLVLSILGTVTSIITGFVLFVIAAVISDSTIMIVPIVIGILEILMLPISITGIILMVRSRRSFKGRLKE